MDYKIISIKNKPILNKKLLSFDEMWNIGFVTIRLQGNTNKKKYKIYFIEQNNQIYVKPFQPYHEYEFEYIFGFDSNCTNYNENVIVSLV